MASKVQSMWELVVVSTGKLYMGMIQFWQKLIWNQILLLRVVVVQERRERVEIRNTLTRKGQLREQSPPSLFSIWKTLRRVLKVGFHQNLLHYFQLILICSAPALDPINLVYSWNNVRTSHFCMAATNIHYFVFLQHQHCSRIMITWKVCSLKIMFNTGYSILISWGWRRNEWPVVLECPRSVWCWLHLLWSAGYDDERSLLMSQKSLEKRFGQSPVFIAATFMEQGGIPPSTNPATLLKEAIHVISCGYEDKTEWGKEVSEVPWPLIESKPASLFMCINLVSFFLPPDWMDLWFCYRRYFDWV